MKIELRAFCIAIESTSGMLRFTAEIWVDDALAFRADSGAIDADIRFSPCGGLDIAEVDAWLAQNRPPRHGLGWELPHCLAFEVAALVDRAAMIEQLRDCLRTSLLVIENGRVLAYPVDLHDPVHLARTIIRRDRNALVLRHDDDAGLTRAAILILASR